MERVMARDWGLDFNFASLTVREMTDAVVLHHTGSAGDDDFSAAALHRSHQAQGWLGIGYHYSIRKDGAIEMGRPRWAVGAHTEGENFHTVGVHLCGNFSIAAPTAAQVESLSLLLANLAADYDLPLNEAHICGHCDFMATACPGETLHRAIPLIIGKAIWYREHGPEE